MRFYILLIISFFVFSPITYAETINFGTQNDGNQQIGSATGLKNIAQKFTLSADASAIDVFACIYKGGSPTEDLRISVRLDSSGHPDNVTGDIVYIDVPASNFNSSCTSPFEITTLTYDFSSSVTYWLMFHRTSGDSDTHRYLFQYHSTTDELDFDTSGVYNWYHSEFGKLYGHITSTESGAEGETPWCGIDVLSTTTPSCGPLGLDACGNVVCMATTTADITAISVTLLNALVFIVAFISVAISLWIFKLLIR